MNRNITDVRGFRARGAHIGIKSKRRDLALIVSDAPASAAGTFTTNRIVAEPVKLTKNHISDGTAQAIVVTSGNANACTGKDGLRAARRVAETVAEELNLRRTDIVVASTGVIGVPFPTEKVVKGIRHNAKLLSKRRIYGAMVANAIMTTDTFQKEAYSHFRINGKTINMAGIAKGAGMIHPNMATMLGFVVSDADIKPSLLRRALKRVVDRSFNMISVDGDTSTNDMVVILSNGMAGNIRIKRIDENYHKFEKCLEWVCKELAKAIVSDGEGATKFVEYKVKNAKCERDARKVVRTISNSNLIRTALFGRDPNWGRIMAAVGRSGVEVNPDRVDIIIGSKKVVPVARNGRHVEYDQKRLKQILKSSRIRIIVDLHQGDACAVGWGTDFSYEYVRINAEYTT
jgi:glutamate N-acetyltransferase/amino-acid N-acetyltransferase